MTGVVEAKGLRFKSGKFEGRSMNEVAAQYPAYIVWCYKSVSGKMGIPHALYVWADNRIKAQRASAEARIRDEEAAMDFGGCPIPPPPDPHRGVFVGDSGSNRLTPFQAATLKVVREAGARIEVTPQWAIEQKYGPGAVVETDRFGNSRVVCSNGVRRPILEPLDGVVQMEERARQFFKQGPEGEPSIFQAMLEETADDSTSFLDGIL